MNLTIREVTDSHTRADVYRFRYKIYVHELNKFYLDADHQQQMIYDNADQDAHILIVEDDNIIVGTLRNSINNKPDIFKTKLNVSALEKHFDPTTISFTSYFMVDPKYRKGLAGPMLVSTIFNFAFQQGVHADLCLCELPLLKLYQRLGYRQISTPILIANNQWRIPMILSLRDYDYLLKVSSPFALSLSEKDNDHGITAKRIQSLYPEFDISGENNQLSQGSLYENRAA